jgi:hypothetical protein
MVQNTKDNLRMVWIFLICNNLYHNTAYAELKVEFYIVLNHLNFLSYYATASCQHLKGLLQTG